MRQKMDAVLKHKQHILYSIKVEEAKKEARTAKPVLIRQRRHYRRRYRFDTYNVGEVQCR